MVSMYKILLTVIMTVLYLCPITGHLFEGSFVQNGVVNIGKYDAKPSPRPNPMPIGLRFGQNIMTIRTSELSPLCPC